MPPRLRQSEMPIWLSCACRWAPVEQLHKEIGAALKPGCIVTDVGSVKAAVVRDVAPHLPAGVHFVPGHPIAGTEQSGPASGFADLFLKRWCILTPLPDSDASAVTRLEKFWHSCGSEVELMTPEHHDLVLAITSHLPHLIAYNTVATAADLEEVTDLEVIKYSAGGFRDFTRIAASDPTMWRDVFLNNREAVLEMLGRFSEDLSALQRAIRWGDGETLFNLFTPGARSAPEHYRGRPGNRGAGFRPRSQAPLIERCARSASLINPQ